MSKIPQELQDYINDNLQGDRRALLPCALVCKAWHRRSRCNLYHTICIDWTDEARSIQLFEALVETKDLVRDLVISCTGGIGHEDFVRLIEALDNLESLVVRPHNGDPSSLYIAHNIACSRKLGERLFFAIANMESLRHLEFADDGILDGRGIGGWPREIVIVASGLRKLQSLDGYLSPPRRLHTLWDAIIAAKAHSGALPLLHLKASTESVNIPPLMNLLVQLGAQLRSLHLSVHNFGTHHELSLGPCTSLRKISVHVQGLEWITSETLARCTALLTTLPREAPLECIVVTITYFKTEHLQTYQVEADASALDKHLASRETLRRVDWDLVRAGGDEGDVTEDMDVVIGLLSPHLPQLAERVDVKMTWGIRRLPGF